MKLKTKHFAQLVLALGLAFSVAPLYSVSSVSAESITDAGSDSVNTPLLDSHSVSAESNTEEGSDIIFKPMFDGYLYSKSSETLSKNQEFSYIATNSVQNTTDSVSRSVTHSHSNSTTLGGSAEFNGLMAKATYKADTSFGNSYSETVTVTWSIPYGKYECVAGMELDKVTGTRDYYISGSLIYKEPMTVNYTVRPYSDKKPV